MKSSRGIIINIISIATALVCVSLTFWGNLKNNGVLTTDAYIGVIATLIGICATIMVGLQIWNHIEFRDTKEKIKDIDSTRSAINDQKDEILKMKIELKQSIGQLYVATANNPLCNSMSHYYRAQSILQDFWCCEGGDKDIIRSSVLLGRMQTLYDNIQALKQPFDPHLQFYCQLFYDDLICFDIPTEYPDYKEIYKIKCKITAMLDNIFIEIEKASQNNNTNKQDNNE